MSGRISGELISAMELCINSIKPTEETEFISICNNLLPIAYNISFDAFKKSYRELNKMYNETKNLEIFYNYLDKRGYRVKPKNGACADKDKLYLWPFDISTRFYTDSYIPQSVIYKFTNGNTIRTEHKTVLKIIIALRMPLKIAIKFMDCCGSGFCWRDDVDKIVYAYIFNNYFGKDDIDEIIYDLCELFKLYNVKNILYPDLADI